MVSCIGFLKMLIREGNHKVIAVIPGRLRLSQHSSLARLSGRQPGKALCPTLLRRLASQQRSGTFQWSILDVTEARNSKQDEVTMNEEVERQLFERWIRSDEFFEERWLRRDSFRGYRYHLVENRWKAWLARSKLSP